MSTVIKAAGPARSSEVGSFNFDDMTARANQYLESVRKQAGEILAKAQADALAVRKSAEEQGRAAALKAAEKILETRVAAQLITLAPALEAAIQKLNTARADWLNHWEKTAVHVATAIAGRIVRQELKQSPEITLTLVREALELTAGKGEIQLRLHPEDFSSLGPQVERLTEDLARLSPAKIIPDPTISKGGCRVDTQFGFVDQQLEAQLARIEEELN